MSSDLEPTNQGVRPNPPPKPECCREEGQTGGAAGRSDQTRKEAAPGVDGVTFEEYRKNLDSNLRDLVRRLKQKSYRARRGRRKYLPQGPGKGRPWGLATLEDKLVQCAVAQILCAIYAADFLPCSDGYREGYSPQAAVRELTPVLYRGRYEFVGEADIQGFFDHLRHHGMLKRLAPRIEEGALLNLIRKWMQAGILEEDGKVKHPEAGTPQGGIVSPVWANVYWHDVRDRGFERRVRKVNRGQSRWFRCADELVGALDDRHAAEGFVQALAERLEKSGWELAPDKTQCWRLGRGGGPYNGRLDFLGFEFRWEKGLPEWTPERQTPHPPQEMARSGGAVHPMDQRGTAWETP